MGLFGRMCISDKVIYRNTIATGPHPALETPSTTSSTNLTTTRVAIPTSSASTVPSCRYCHCTSGINVAGHLLLRRTDAGGPMSGASMNTYSALLTFQKGRCLGTRINEHKLAIRRRDPLSLVFAHALEYDHRFNWDGTEVVAMANTKRAREFLEAWYSDAGSINRHVDLDAHYEGLRSRMTAACPNHASTTANTAARIPTDSSPALPLQHGVPYVGETGKRLCTRLHEHQLAVNREDKLSLVYGHIQQEKHSFAFGEASVIGRASDKMARLVLESWSSVDTINRAIDLHPAYQALRTRLQSVRTGPTALANKSRLSQQLSPSQQGERASRVSDDRREISTHRRAQTADPDSHMQRQLISPSNYGGRAQGHTDLAATTAAGQGAEVTPAPQRSATERPKPIPRQQAVYRPPRRDNMADARLLEEFEKFATRPDILIMGDFNAPHIDWGSTHANSSQQTFDRSFLNTAL
nr:unnamed protein product [Spirometra erinaceieuropaei]